MSGNGSFYCHELVAAAYSDLGIEKKGVTMFKLFRIQPRFLAESFRENGKFRTVMEKCV